MVTSFADGSKISFEQTIVANATGFKVSSRGMSRGLQYTGDILKIGELYDVEELRALGGAIEYVVGTPLTKVYRLAEHADPKQQHYLNLCKMGAGPLYSFFFPYHLVHFEVPNAIARTVLFRDPVTKPLGGPVVEVCAVAKRNLKAGEVLDDYGMYMTYGEAANVEEMSACRYLPEGLVQGCMLTRDITKGPPVGWRTDCGRSSSTNSAVRLAAGCAGRLADWRTGTAGRGQRLGLMLRFHAQHKDMVSGLGTLLPDRIVFTPRQSLSCPARLLAGDHLGGSPYRMRCDEADTASFCD